MNGPHVLAGVRAAFAQWLNVVSLVSSRVSTYVADAVVLEDHLPCPFLLLGAAELGLVAAFAGGPCFLGVILAGLKLGAVRVRAGLTGPHRIPSL